MPKNTDWNAYYDKPYKTATYSRAIVSKQILTFLNNIATPTVCEIGGGNSCFIEKFYQAKKPLTYTVFDNNALSFTKMKNRIPSDMAKHVEYIEENCLSYKPTKKYDLVYSVGLIEHFDIDTTAKVVTSHINMVKDGGYCLISFPTPTILYNLTRKIAELLGLWIFHDERPLPLKEFYSHLQTLPVTVLNKKTIYPIFLTQHMVLLQKNRTNQKSSDLL